LNGSPKSSPSFIENHIVKITEDGYLTVTLPTFEEKIDYDVGETASWTVLIDFTEYNQPVFNLQWYKNGRPIQNYNVNDTNSEKRYEIVDSADYHTSLTVRNVSKTDEGDFQLFINIADGNHQSFMINFTLRVRGLIFQYMNFYNFYEKLLSFNFQMNLLILLSKRPHRMMINWASFVGSIRAHLLLVSLFLDGINHYYLLKCGEKYLT